MTSTAPTDPPTATLWEDALAEQVLAARRERGVDDAVPVVCASGISPSGPIHMGNLREVFTTHLVAEALRRRGAEVMHLHSWDDYDRFRKVPTGVDPGFEQYVGFPLAQIPDPVGDSPSYADHFMDELRASLQVLGVELTERRQSQLYPAGTYNAAVRHAMDERAHVFDVLAGQQTAGRHDRPLEERRAEYFPFKPYCTECHRDDTRVTAYAEETVTWECRHGHAGTMSLADGQAISGKLVWKVDWPMRWAHETVQFEPAGEDHHAPTASFTVGRTIVRDLYGGQARETTVYSFVSLAGVGGKMSGSVGGAPIPATALDVIEPAIVRWLYIRRLPHQSFQIDLSARAIQRLYDEWDRLMAAVEGPDCDPADAAIFRESVQTSTGPVAHTERPVSFRLLASVADITQGDRGQMGRIIAAHLGDAGDADTLLAQLQPRLDCAIRYATEVVPESERTILRTSFDAATFAALDQATRDGVAELAAALAAGPSLEDLTTLVYAIPKAVAGLAADADPTPEVKVAQRAFFKAVYRLLVGTDTGPRLPTLLLSIGRDRARELLTGPS